MSLLYRLFYTTISLSILMTALAPVILLLRFFMRNHEKKYTLRTWCLFYLRSICPIALSSVFCMFPDWNRSFHLLLANMGLTIQGSHGIMQSWRAVFTHDISASVPFAICSIVWVAGIIFGILFFCFRRHKLSKQLQTATELGENIYETDFLTAPLQLGIRTKRLYLPKAFQAKEITWLLQSRESSRLYSLRTFVTGMITLIHWFNPFMWLYRHLWQLDAAIDIDERTVFHREEAIRKEYAQSILNFQNTSSAHTDKLFAETFLGGKTETATEKRAARMLYQKWDTKTDSLALFLLLSILTIFCFILAPIRLAWQQSTSVNTASDTNSESLFSKTATVVAKMGTTSPEGLERTIQLEMTSGKEKGNGYEGEFVIRMYDSIENEIASCKLADVFPDSAKKKLYFPKNTTLCISDYNNDNTQELVIGQQTEIPKKLTSSSKKNSKTAYKYAILNLEDNTITVIGSDIIAVSSKSESGASVAFQQPDGIQDIFTVPKGDDTDYYVWNKTTSLYEKKNMTEESLNTHKKNIENSNGETQEHTLKEKDNTEAVLVTTKKDSTQSEEIQSVILFPRKQSKKFEDIKGYYCDVLWVTDTNDSKKQRYAQVIYNGTKAQTFTLYDLQQKNVTYQHEDGTQCLSDVFKQYKEDNITFKENGAVIYSLAEKNKDTLTISFAADADGGITVKGSYNYDLLKKTTSNLTFSRAETSQNDSKSK